MEIASPRSGRFLAPSRARSRIDAKHLLAVLLLLALNAAVKLPVWELHPQIFSDSAGYIVPALSLVSGRGYGVQQDGFRTPTYPLFLALVLLPSDTTHLATCQDAHRPACLGSAAQSHDGAAAIQVIAIVQILLGGGILLLLYLLGWRLTHNRLIAVLSGAGYAFNLAAAFWENSILTETLTTLLLLLAVYLVIRGTELGGRGRIALGAILGALALCHSLYLLYWGVPALFLFIYRERTSWRSALMRILPVVLIPALCILAWSAFNYFVNGVLTPSTLSGYVLIQMVAPVVEKAPPGYDYITEIYVGFRNAMMQETGSDSGAIFRAWPAMIDATGLTWSQISAKLTNLALYLIGIEPLVYLHSVWIGWQRFWDFALYHYDPIPATLPGAAGFTDDAWQSLMNILFWAASFLLTLITALRSRIARLAPPPLGPILLVMLTVWFAAVFASATNFQDNARLRASVLPLQYATILYTLWLAGTLIARRRKG
ncbi:MAG: hypothetical protein WCF84_01295 [Anaerolineae bacterium]